LWEAAEGRLLYGGWLSGDMWDIGQCHDKKTDNVTTLAAEQQVPMDSCYNIGVILEYC
jgi:hypothetical protein